MSVFISGASSGIGEACALRFAENRHDLVLVARRLDRLNELKNRIQSNWDIKVSCFELDIRNSARVKEFFTENSQVLSKVDILVNNAGLAKGLELMQNSDLEDWETMIDTNVKGLLYLTRFFLPQLIKIGNKAHIINLGSVSGHWVYTKGAVYCASKFAVQAITEGLRMDLNGTGVRVSVISPGMVETEFSAVRFKGDENRAKSVYQNKNPLQAKDIAEAVLWCVDRPLHVNIQEIVLFPTDQPCLNR